MENLPEMAGRTENSSSWSCPFGMSKLWQSSPHGSEPICLHYLASSLWCQRNLVHTKGGQHCTGSTQHKGCPWKGMLRTLVRRGGMCLSFTWWCGAQWRWTHLRRQRTKAALLCSRKARMKNSISLAILTMFLADVNAWDGRKKERPWCSWCCVHTGHPWHSRALLGAALVMDVQIVVGAQPQPSRRSLGSGDSPLGHC